MPTPFVKRPCQVGQVGRTTFQAFDIAHDNRVSDLGRYCPTYALTRCVGWTLFAQRLRGTHSVRLVHL